MRDAEQSRSARLRQSLSGKWDVKFRIGSGDEGENSEQFSGRTDEGDEGE